MFIVDGQTDDDYRCSIIASEMVKRNKLQTRTRKMPKVASPDDLQTVSETARRLAKSAQTIRDWADSGKLPAVRTRTGQRIFRRGDVERLARELNAPDED
jgi:excisionase family DNA binding protein